MTPRPSITRRARRRSQEILEQEGVGSLVRRVSKKALRPVVSVDRVVFFETDLTGPLPELEARVPLELQVLTNRDFRNYQPELSRMSVDALEADRRFSRGDVAVLGRTDGQLAGIHWVTFSDPYVTEVGARLLLEPGDAVSYNIVTVAELRGMGVSPAMSCFVNRYERSRGCLRHISWVRADNLQSLRTISKLGRRRVKTVWRLWTRGMTEPRVIGAEGHGPDWTVRVPRHS